MAAHIIFVGGNKGGSGKTTISHLLCTGLALLGHSMALVTTDNRPLRTGTDRRPYQILDGRTVKQLADIVASAPKIEGDVFLVIDGAASRSGELDKALAGHVDVFLVPFTDFVEDLELAAEYCAAHKNAWALPNRWPTSPMAVASVAPLLEQIGAAVPGRVLPPVPQVAGSKVLCEDDLSPSDIVTRTRNVARALARSVLDILKIS